MDRLLTAPDRDAEVDGAPPRLPSSPQSRLPAGRVPSPRVTPVHPLRRVVVGVVVGALTMFGIATLDTFGGAEVPVLGSLAALPDERPDEPAFVEVPAPPSTPGTCLTWTRPDAADTALVDCAQPHLFEQAGVVLLADQVELPGDATWRQLVNERCTPVVLDYLDNRFDPDGRFRVGALKPSPAKWAEGDRELRCGLQSASRSGALYPLTGRVADTDQSAVQEPGVCLAIDGRTVGDPVDCAGSHALETVGIIDMAADFPDAYPAVTDQDNFLQPRCNEVAAAYAGSPEVIAEKGLTVYWNNISEESWAAGSRRANCNVAALLPDRSGFAPVTGPVTGEVAVGAEVAPPATDTPDPGVPASPTTAPAPEEPTSEAPTPDGGAQPPPAGEETPPPAGEEPPPAEVPEEEPAPLDPVPLVEGP